MRIIIINHPFASKYQRAKIAILRFTRNFAGWMEFLCSYYDAVLSFGSKLCFNVIAVKASVGFRWTIFVFLIRYFGDMAKIMTLKWQTLLLSVYKSYTTVKKHRTLRSGDKLSLGYTKTRQMHSPDNSTPEQKYQTEKTITNLKYIVFQKMTLPISWEKQIRLPRPRPCKNSARFRDFPRLLNERCKGPSLRMVREGQSRG